VREVDAATLKAWMGHAKLTTTERYLHSKPRHTDVVRLDRAFAVEPPLTGETATAYDGSAAPASGDAQHAG
jgi:hypothetical protein